jgi:ribonuclease BN (tRNA processing enzyme)
MTTRLITLGTAGGALTFGRLVGGRREARHGIASAVVVGDRYYLVDFGQGVQRQLTLALLGEVPPSRTMAGFAAGFITHMHSDHTMDLANLVLCGANQAWPRDRTVPIWGPGRRPRPDGARPGGPPRDDCCSAGENPDVPGTAGLIDDLAAAYAADTFDRTVSEGRESPWNRVAGHDVPLPAGTTPDTVEAVRGGLALAPWTVFEDDRVRVSATLVTHGQVYPALAYRFDTDDGAIAFSGDTSPCAGLVRLAQGADILVHECFDASFADWEQDGPRPPGHDRRLAAVLAKHTTPAQVGAVAAAAGARQLVLSHIVPAFAPPSIWRPAQRGFDGVVLVGQDLMEVTLGRPAGRP